MNSTGKSQFNQARIEWAMRLKYSPMPELDMDMLTRYRNAARIGELRDAGKIWEVMVEVDGELGVNADKRAADLASLAWDIKSDGSLIGDQHKEALHYFYNNLTATEALDQDEVGGVPHLIYQTCHSAHLYKYHASEMLMRIDNAGAKQVTCEFRRVPVWFMESRRGYLGYLQHIFDMYGQPCIEGEWFTVVGRGWMRALMTAFAVKWFPMRDWLLFCQRYGAGFLIGETDAEQGTDEWNQALSALETLANDATVLANRSTSFKFLEQSQKNHTPFEPLIDRVDRLYAKCLRGVDLATGAHVGSPGAAGGAGGKPIGANMQMEESGILLAQDVPWFNGYANRRIDRPVIRYLFNQEPRAKFVLLHGEEEETPAAQDTQTWVNMGLPVSIAQARERTGWREPEDDEPILSATAVPSPGGAGAPARDANNDTPKKNTAGDVPKPKPETPPVNGGRAPAPDTEPRRYSKPNWAPAKKATGAIPAKTGERDPIAAGAKPGAVQTSSPLMPDPQVDASGAWSKIGAVPVDAQGKALPMPSLAYSIPNAADVPHPAVEALAVAHADDLAPIAHELESILTIQDEKLWLKKLREFVSEHGPLVKLLADVNASPKAAKVINDFTTKQFAAALKKPAETTALENYNHNHGNHGLFSSDAPGGGAGKTPLEKVKAVMNGKLDEAVYAPMKPEVASQIKATGGPDVSDHSHFIDGGALVHIDRYHGLGKEKNPGNLPITKADIEKIPEIVDRPDKVAYSGATGRNLPSVKYQKKFDDGTTYYVEEQWAKEKLLATKTMYKEKS